MSNQIEQDLLDLATSYETEADKMHEWAVGCGNTEWARKYEDYAVQYRQLAAVYRRMSEHGLTFVETYSED